MTFDDFLRRGEIQAKMETYQRKKAAAITLCEKLLREYKAPYLSLSGGKDSAAMAYIVDEAARRCGKSFRLWAHVSDASFPGTVETIREIADRLGRPLDLYESTGAFEALAGQKKQSFGKSGVFFDSVREYARDKDLSFVGVRAWESARRRRAAKVHGPVFESKSMGDVTVCHPILWFRLEDVAAAMVEYDVPIHPIYRKADIGGGQNRFGEDTFIRLSYATSRDLLNKGTAVFIAYNYPEIYAKLCEVWPEIRKYV